MIKSVIFDLGGVYFTNGTKIAIEKISKKYSIKRDSIEKILKPGSKFGKLYRKGKISANEFFDKFKKYLKIKASNKELFNIWFGSYKPLKDVVNTVKNVRKKGFKVYFLSDNVKDRAEYLQKRYNFVEHFDDGILSHIVGVTKFDGTKIFKLAIKQTREKPENILFVDDNEKHVATARRLRMNVIYFKNPKQLEKELTKLNLL